MNMVLQKIKKKIKFLKPKSYNFLLILKCHIETNSINLELICC